MSTPESVAAMFALEGEIASVEPLGRGHINDSYLVTTQSGRQGVLQRINAEVFSDPDAVVENVAVVVAHLNAAPAQGLRVPGLVAGSSGAMAVHDEDHEVWRMLEFIAETRSLQQLESIDQAHEAGRAFGLFQRCLADLPEDRLTAVIPRFHELDWQLARLSGAAGGDLGSVSEDLGFVAERRHLAERPLSGERVVIHGDCKVDNLLFEADDDVVSAVVDLDTVMIGDPFWDFGDLVRSAAASAAEDARTVDVSLDLFEAVTEGFLAGSGRDPDRAQRESMVRAVRYMTMMLGVRFLTDYLEGNRYFKVDDPQHNLRRARAQFRLVEALERNASAMNGIVMGIGA